MNGIISLTLAHIRNSEEKMRRAKRKEMNKQRIENAKAVVKKTGKAIQNFIKCSVRKMGGSGGREDDDDAMEL